MRWQVTATTLFCEVVDEWATILVYKDGTVKCGYVAKYGQVNRKVSRDQSRECPGPSVCVLCLAYKEKIISEDAKKTEG